MTSTLFASCWACVRGLVLLALIAYTSNDRNTDDIHTFEVWGACECAEKGRDALCLLLGVCACLRLVTRYCTEFRSLQHWRIYAREGWGYLAKGKERRRRSNIIPTPMCLGSAASAYCTHSRSRASVWNIRERRSGLLRESSKNDVDALCLLLGVCACLRLVTRYCTEFRSLQHWRIWTVEKGQSR
jgi:hypothetical protein